MRFVSWSHALFFFSCSDLPVVQAVGVTNTFVIPSPVITVGTAATGSGTSQQPQRGTDDIATQGLFVNRTDDSDDDYDN